MFSSHKEKHHETTHENHSVASALLTLKLCLPHWDTAIGAYQDVTPKPMLNVTYSLGNAKKANCVLTFYVQFTPLYTSFARLTICILSNWDWKRVVSFRENGIKPKMSAADTRKKKKDGKRSYSQSVKAISLLLNFLAYDFHIRLIQKSYQHSCQVILFMEASSYLISCLIPLLMKTD